MNLDFDPNKDYYAILGVSENASQDEIKKAFRKLAMQYHPDRAPDDKKKEYEQKFKEINEAYQVLGDEQKRKQYDAFRKGGFWWFGGFGGFDFGSDFGQGSVFDVNDIFDLFWEFFGGGFKQRKYEKKPQRGEDILITLPVSFEESYTGTKKKIEYERYVVCDRCKGKGVDPDSQKIKCPVCWGSWVIIQTKRTPFGVFQTQKICTRCWWTWYIDSKPCSKCWGSGLIIKRELVEIEIPEAVKDWQVIKIPWMGNYWPYWWQPWDLLIKVLIKPSEKWQRSGYNLITNVPISVYDAVLGWEVEISLPDWKKVKVKIPKGLQPGDKIVVAGKGFKISWWIFGKRGDLIIKPIIQLPKKLSKEEEELWKKLKQLSKW